MEYSATIPIEPVAKQRPRLARRGKRIYTPKKTSEFESAIARFIEADWEGLRRFSGPLLLRCTFVRKRPRSLPKSLTEGLVICHKRPDLDNYVKALSDGLDKSGIWGDDGQVAMIHAEKYYAEVDGEPRIWFEIQELNGGDS